MRLARRIIPCLDVDGARVVKGVNFVGLRDAGDPAELAARYNAEGADELVVLDIAASRDRRPTFLETIRRVAERLAIPLTAGGGIRTLDDARAVVEAGADKVTVNTAAVGGNARVGVDVEIAARRRRKLRKVARIPPAVQGHLVTACQRGPR